MPNIIKSEISTGYIKGEKGDKGDTPELINALDPIEPGMGALDAAVGSVLFQSVSDGKSAVASAITGKGVPTEQDATFETMAQNISSITTGEKLLKHLEIKHDCTSDGYITSTRILCYENIVASASSRWDEESGTEIHTIIVSEDGGETFEERAVPAGINMSESRMALANGILYICSASGSTVSTFTSTDYGETYTRKDCSVSPDVLFYMADIIASVDYLYLVYSSSRVQRVLASSDKGVTWEEIHQKSGADYPDAVSQAVNCSFGVVLTGIHRDPSAGFNLILINGTEIEEVTLPTSTFPFSFNNYWDFSGLVAVDDNIYLGLSYLGQGYREASVVKYAYPDMTNTSENILIYGSDYMNEFTLADSGVIYSVGASWAAQDNVAHVFQHLPDIHCGATLVGPENRPISHIAMFAYSHETNNVFFVAGNYLVGGRLE